MSEKLPLPTRSTHYEIIKSFAEKLVKEDKLKSSKKTLWKIFAEFGLFDILIVDEKTDSIKLADTLMALGEGLKDSGILLALGAHCFAAASSILAFGTPSQKEIWLFQLKNGSVVAAFAATELEAGSDVMSLKTSYKLKDDKFVLKGSKAYITNFSDADLIIVFATKDPRLHSRGISAFLVPKDTKGISFGKNEDRIGLHNCTLGSIYFDNLVLPSNNLLGKIGQGNQIFQRAIICERILILAAQVGIMRHQLERCISFAKSRKQFGKPIGSNQFIMEKIINIYRNYMTSRLLAYDAVSKFIKNELPSCEASLTKLHISECAVASNLDSMCLHGALGYTIKSGIAEQLCDSLGGLIYSGTSDLQKLIIATDFELLD